MKEIYTKPEVKVDDYKNVDVMTASSMPVISDDD